MHWDIHVLFDLSLVIVYQVEFLSPPTRCQVEELQEVATELEREKENLLRKVSQRDKQIESYKEQLTANQKQQAELQSRLAKVCIKIDH